MRILVHSNAPWQNTGYGKQTALLAPRLASLGHEVAISAASGLHGSATTWNGITVYPGGSEPWGMDIVGGHYRNFRADLLLTLMDVWVINPAMLAGSGMRVAHWIPVDCRPLGVIDRECLELTGATPIAISRHGEKMLKDAGFQPLYAPHGIDTSVFAPPADREFLRREMGVSGRYAVGMNAANMDKSRKGFSEAFQAFAAFRKKQKNALLMVNTAWQNENVQRGDGLDLQALAGRCGIGDAVAFTDQYDYRAGFVTDEALARFYGCLDVFMNPALGEGFGIPVVEAQACGVPVIVTKASSMPELCGAGWQVEGQDHWAWLHQAWWVCPSVPGIARALEQARRDAPGLRYRARKFALRYDADAVLREHWVPVLEALEGTQALLAA